MSENRIDDMSLLACLIRARF